MPDVTRFLSWPIPEERAVVWYQAFLDLMNAVDADTAARLTAQDLLEPFVAYGFTVNVLAGNQTIRVATGVAYTKRRRVVLPTPKDFSVASTGVVHTEYLYLDSLDNLVLSTTSPDAESLPLANVSVDANGLISSVTDVRETRVRMKVLGQVVLTIASDHVAINGKLRVGDDVDPMARVHVVGGDVVVDAEGRGIILKDSQNPPHYWRETVDNLGNRVITDLGTSIPP
ncbi:MAG: hypothetical protein V2G41_09360 [bacterium JZ-2024 1]